MIPKLVTALLLMLDVVHGNSVDPVGQVSWGPWKLVSKSCEKGANTESMRRQCFVGDVVVNARYCNGPDGQDRPCEKFNTDAIVRGEDVKDLSRWTWQVFIELDNGRDQCGGTLISSEWVLTAAHCFAGKNPTNILMGTTTKSGKDPTTVAAKVDRICCHKDYDGDTLQNDICLVKIIAELNHVTKPVLLPEVGAEVATGKSCWITGWGYDENDNLPDLLQEAEVFIIDRNKCKEWYESGGTLVVNNTICAGHERGGADTCGGDSGGPLVCSGDKGYVLHGITSYGPVFCGSARLPGIYTKVTDFLQWISDTMKKPCPKYTWAPWVGTCSVTCGIGTEHRKRVCVDEENNEVLLMNCKGPSQQFGPCRLSECSKYHWGPWEGTCSTTCGPGVKTEKRVCLDEGNATVPVENCEGESRRFEVCTSGECEDYHWSDWKLKCSVTCGDGTMLKVRDCFNQNGAKVANGRCDGAATEQAICSLPPCVDYAWTGWTERCTVTCGRGVTIISRKCIDLRGERVKDSNCRPGRPTRREICDLPACISAPPGFKWGPWNTVCGVTCGAGTQTRTRNCMNAEGEIEHNFNKCAPGKPFELGTCRRNRCPQDTSYSWGGWSPWSSCFSGNSADPCNGYRYATRTCLQNNKEVSPLQCGVPPHNQKQTTCSNEGCNDPIPVFNFEEWRRNLFGSLP